MLFVALVTALHLWILYYLVQLQKSNCSCALGLKHRLIRTYLSIMIPLTVLMIILSIIRSGTLATFIHRNPQTTVAIYVGFLLLKIAYIATVFLYIRELKDSQCDCSQHRADRKSVV